MRPSFISTQCTTDNGTIEFAQRRLGRSTNKSSPSQSKLAVIRASGTNCALLRRGFWLCVHSGRCSLVNIRSSTLVLLLRWNGTPMMRVPSHYGFCRAVYLTLPVHEKFCVQETKLQHSRTHKGELLHGDNLLSNVARRRRHCDLRRLPFAQVRRVSG